MSEKTKNQEATPSKEYEFNSYSAYNISDSSFWSSIFNYFDKDEIDAVLRDPIANHETAIRLSEFVYTKNGMVGNSIDYQTSLMTLDRVVTAKVPPNKINKSRKDKIEGNKHLMLTTLDKIDDKAVIRDGLFTDMVDGIAFKYFETKRRQPDKTKFLSDYEVENIMEINNLGDIGINATVITLPWQYTKIVGKKNGRYVLAFDLKYFNDLSDSTLEQKLKKMPLEIVEAYNNKNRKGDWIVLDNDKTMCVKIKCKDSEPWGRSTIISALSDVLYKDYFTDAKRNVLDEVCSRLIVQTFPENRQGTGSTLNKTQQEVQHNALKNAIVNRTAKSGTSFVSVAAGTKIDSLDASTDLFDEKNEANLNNDIACDMGVSAALLGAITTGTFAGGVHNLSMITAQLYSWVCEWKKELVHVINANIIKDKKNPVDIYYFPTSFVNRKEFFDMAKTLYSEASGSLSFLVASAGISPDVYFSILDSEIESGVFERYKPHQTSYTMSSKDNKGGRPSGDNALLNQNTNILPSPSDNM